MTNRRAYEGTEPSIDPTACIDPTALVIGDVTVGANSSLWPFAIARGDVNRIRIGERTNVQDHAILHVSHVGPFNPEGADLVVGDDVTVGHRAILHGCKIADRCLIGMGAIIMDDVLVESEVIVGAASLVPPGKTLRGGFLYVGTPAQEIRPLTDREREQLTYSAGHYAQLARNHQAAYV